MDFSVVKSCSQFWIVNFGVSGSSSVDSVSIGLTVFFTLFR